MNSEDIKKSLVYAGMTQAELSRRIGSTPVNFQGKLKRDNFRESELDSIAKVLGAKHVSYFEFPDGVRFGTKEEKDLNADNLAKLESTLKALLLKEGDEPRE